MNDWVTLISFTYVHEAAVLQSKLESEGIECQVKNANTLQVHHFLSNAVGGVQLQVKRSDYEHAMALLRETGREPDAPQPNPLLQGLLAFSKHIPFGKSWHPYTQIAIVLGAFFTLLVASVLFLIIYLSPKEVSISKSPEQIQRELASPKLMRYPAIENLTVDSLCMYQPEEAIAFINREQAAGTFPKTIAHNKGIAFYQMGQVDEALQEFHTLLQPKGLTDPAVWYNIALCHAKKLQLDSSAHHFQLSLRDLDRGPSAPTKNPNVNITLRTDVSHLRYQWKFHCLVHLGNLSYSAKELNRATHYYSEASREMRECSFFSPSCQSEREYANTLLTIAYNEAVE